MLKVRPPIILLTIILIVAVLSTLLLPWEPSSETTGYWVFSRILLENGRFSVPDRSPLYALYLIPFLLFKYPYSVYLEYSLTTFLSLYALIVFLKKYMGSLLATIGALVWLPFIVISEPSVQKLALASVSMAVVLRETTKSRFAHAWFYTLLLFAYFFRFTYGPIILFFAAYDFYKQIRKYPRRISNIFHISVKTDWPLLMPIVLYLLFVLFQSPHPWNTTTFSSSQWFPFDAKKMPTTFFLNQIYIRENYHSLETRDIYYSNQLLFGGAKTIYGAFGSNPKFIISHIGENLSSFFSAFAKLTLISPILDRFTNVNLLNCMLFVLINLGALLAVRNTTRLYFLAIISTLVVGFTISLTSPRYLFPLVPIIIVSMWWYGKTFINLLLLSFPNKIFTTRTRIVASVILVGLLFIISSSGDSAHYGDISLGWSGIIYNISVLPKKNNITIMTSNNSTPLTFSMHASFPILERLSQQCHGIMTLEYPFIGAFMQIPLSYIYDIWEIPPFGNYRNSIYNGLRPERINCLFVSHGLSYGEGQPTNNLIRYNMYIKPYENDLISQGARRYNIPSYGYVVILQDASLKKKYEKR